MLIENIMKLMRNGNLIINAKHDHTYLYGIAQIL